MRVQNKLIKDIVEDVFNYSTQVANMKFCDYEKVKRIIARKEFLKVKYDDFSGLSNDDVKELIFTLKNKENIIRIKEINKNVKFEFEEFSFYSSLLEELENPLFFEFKQSIELFIKKNRFQDNLIEKAEKVSITYDTETLLYLFKCLGNSKYYHEFLMILYGECLYRNTEVLEKKQLKEFFNNYINSYWENKLSNTMCELEQAAIKHLMTNTSESTLRGGYTVDYNRGSIIIKPNDLEKAINKLIHNDPLKEIDSAVEESCRKSNGKVFISSQTINKKDDIGNITAILNKHKNILSLENDITLKSISNDVAFALILKLALGYYCAYCSWGNLIRGRLRAWKTVSGLAGLNLKKGNIALNKPLSKCKWFVFKRDSNWFYEEMGGIWLVCINEDKNLITMLCATDTD